MVIQSIAKTAVLIYFLSLTFAQGTLAQATGSQASAAQISADNPEQDTTPIDQLPDTLAAAVTKQHEMVVTANPMATAVGERILRAGGTAAEALIAWPAVCGLV